MKNPFSNVFTNENADYTEPMDIDSVGEIVFEANTRRQFIRRLSNGIVGLGVANNVGSIIYKTRDDEIIAGNILEIDVNDAQVDNLKLSFVSSGEYRGKRDELRIPVNIISSNGGVVNFDETVEIQTRCEHENGFEYRNTEKLDKLDGEKNIMLGISNKNTISKSGPPRYAEIIAKYQ